MGADGKRSQNRISTVFPKNSSNGTSTVCLGRLQTSQRPPLRGAALFRFQYVHSDSKRKKKLRLGKPRFDFWKRCAWVHVPDRRSQPNLRMVQPPSQGKKLIRWMLRLNIWKTKRVSNGLTSSFAQVRLNWLKTVVFGQANEYWAISCLPSGNSWFMQTWNNRQPLSMSAK